jgi:hypothetical protein
MDLVLLTCVIVLLVFASIGAGTVLCWLTR